MIQTLKNTLLNDLIMAFPKRDTTTKREWGQRALRSAKGEKDTVMSKKTQTEHHGDRKVKEGREKEVTRMSTKYSWLTTGW